MDSRGQDDPDPSKSRRLFELAGLAENAVDAEGQTAAALLAERRPPDGSARLSPLLQSVAAAAAIHPLLADFAMRVAPPTHRLKALAECPIL